MENSCSWCHQNDVILFPGVLSAQDTHRSPRCPGCARVITLISITAAAQVVNVSRKTIYQWIEKGLISTVRSAAGRQLVCFSSLFNARSKKFA
jgi:excisionase family DNA binding protein